MNNCLSVQNGLHVPFPFKSENMSILENYCVVPFEEGNTDGACVARIIEIHKLNKLRIKGKKLNELTGLSIPDSLTTGEEINLLLKHFTHICRKKEDELSFLQNEFSDAEFAWENATSSKSIRNISDATTKGTTKADMEYRYRAALSRLNEQKERLGIIKLLPGLLADEADYIEKGIDKRLLHRFPGSLCIPPGLMSVLHDGVLIQSISFILEQLDTLDKAVQDIINCCSVPTDKYLLNNGGAARAFAYREYYSVNSGSLRSLIAARDYVEHVMKYRHIAEFKNKLFS
ncbi:hypothetical protein [Cedecea sp. FDAARGOS_727]|uniref:hypothetical protein n=1 Tax=Cedecea sp. FDAARGOS_727 TaxID=2545798 RepID=UPI00143E9067|nr:hypothetical protein [Cedecea sp. FDAARGOS_727]QIX94996.1 hypothetical protein FOC35_04520 [Cedecea sp. FDAARGOS_727]